MALATLTHMPPLIESTASAPCGNAWRLLRQHGQTLLAFGGLIDGYPLHWSEDGIGFCSYGIAAGTAVLLEGPVCPPEHRTTLARHWATAMRQRGYQTAAVHVERDVAEALCQQGHRATPVGVVSDLDLQQFDFALPGKQFTHLRRWRNTARNAGLVVNETTDDAAFADRVAEQLSQWQCHQGPGKAYRFVVRQNDRLHEPGARSFVATRDGAPLAIAGFDPLYREGETIGYYLSINRRSPRAPHGASDLLLLEAMQRFAAEGREFVSLGLSPMWNLHKANGPRDALLHRGLTAVQRYGQAIYRWDGVAFHKSKYRGKERPIYAVCSSRVPIREFVSVLRLCGVV